MSRGNRWSNFLASGTIRLATWSLVKGIWSMWTPTAPWPWVVPELRYLQPSRCSKSIRNIFAATKQAIHSSRWIFSLSMRASIASRWQQAMRLRFSMAINWSVSASWATRWALPIHWSSLPATTMAAATDFVIDIPWDTRSGAAALAKHSRSSTPRFNFLVRTAVIWLKRNRLNPTAPR